MDKQKKWLLRQFHTLCSRLHLSAEEKETIIEGYGVRVRRTSAKTICLPFSGDWSAGWIGTR